MNPLMLASKNILQKHKLFNMRFLSNSLYSSHRNKIVILVGLYTFDYPSAKSPTFFLMAEGMGEWATGNLSVNGDNYRADDNGSIMEKPEEYRFFSWPTPSTVSKKPLDAYTSNGIPNTPLLVGNLDSVNTVSGVPCGQFLRRYYGYGISDTYRTTKIPLPKEWADKVGQDYADPKAIRDLAGRGKLTLTLYDNLPGGGSHREPLTFNKNNHHYTFNNMSSETCSPQGGYISDNIHDITTYQSILQELGYNKDMIYYPWRGYPIAFYFGDYKRGGQGVVVCDILITGTS